MQLLLSTPLPDCEPERRAPPSSETPAFGAIVPGRPFGGSSLLPVLDLALCLPGFVLASVLLWRKRPAGYLLVPYLLVFMILMDLSIGALALAYKVRGLSSDITVTILMGVLAAVTALALLSFLRHGTAAFRAGGVRSPTSAAM